MTPANGRCIVALWPPIYRGYCERRPATPAELHI